MSKALRLRLYERELRLDQPIKRSQTDIHTRQSICVQLQFEHITAYGEACPLPSFAGEDYSTCKQALENAAVNFSQLSTLPEAWSDIESLIPRSKPCAQFALHCALIDAHAQLQQLPIAAFINKHHAAQVQLQSLFVNAPNNDHTFIKLKLGKGSFNEELKHLKDMQNQYPEAQLRLDANGAWSLNDALAHIQDIQHADLHIDYIEDPCADYQDNLHCAQACGVGIALDQIFNASKQREECIHDAFCAFIIKPMCIGSINTLTSLISQLRQRRWIISDFHNGNIARWHYRHLAAAFDQQNDEHHGIAGGALFVNDYCTLNDQSPFPIPQSAGLNAQVEGL